MANYKAKRQFTDRNGKAYKPGDRFEGTPEEADEQLASGNIEEVTAQVPPGTGKGGGGERGGAPA